MNYHKENHKREDEKSFSEGRSVDMLALLKENAPEVYAEMIAMSDEKKVSNVLIAGAGRPRRAPVLPDNWRDDPLLLKYYGSRVSAMPEGGGEAAPLEQD